MTPQNASKISQKGARADGLFRSRAILPASRSIAALPLLPRSSRVLTSGDIIRAGDAKAPHRGPSVYVRTLTARAITSPMMTSEVTDWRPIVSLAQWARGITSVGLNANAFVSPRYR